MEKDITSIILKQEVMQVENLYGLLQIFVKCDWYVLLKHV
jgi:hypothetical protein